MEKAVVVLSGGLDSSTCMGIAQAEGYDLFPITFSYGQRHSMEVESAKKVAKYYKVKEHKVVDVQFLAQIGGSALTDNNISVRVNGLKDDIPETYVPARNLIFISLATAYAEVLNANTIFVGVNALDYSGYPDCRPEFIRSMQEVINLATKKGIYERNLAIKTPLMDLTKGQIIKWGSELGVPYHLTTSCYQGKEYACGVCDSCILRLKGFKENHLVDPIKYRLINDEGFSHE